MLQSCGAHPLIDSINMEENKYEGQVWKLGVSWGAGKRNFFDVLKKYQIVIGVKERTYKPGDIIGIFNGFNLLAVAKVLQESKPVTQRNSFETDFNDYEIDFEEWVNFSPAKIFELPRGTNIVYEERKGIVKIHQVDVRNKIIALVEQYEIAAAQLNNNLKLYRDAPAVIDYLERKPFVEALRQYINRLWDGTNDDSFTMHINEEWGSGKSTVLNLLKENLEGAGEQNWVVVNFNAWQYQHIQVPWWVFLDNVYKSILLNEKFPKRLWVFVREHSWRIFTVNKNKWIAFSAFFLVLIFTFLMNLSFLNIGSLFIGKDSKDKVGIIVSILSLIGTITAFIYATINSLLPGSEDAAINFKKNVRDPMQKIKQHYTSVVSYTEKSVAVFIDDIDRCNPEFVVSLLEGIQTLFRTGKVLYVIAGDASWIRESFEIHYGDLKKVINKPGQSLGNFFVEKTLQQSINLPQVTRELKKTFWKILLEGEPDPIDANSFALSSQKIDDAINDEQINDVIKNANSDLEKTILRQKAAEKMASATNLKHIEHSLLKYFELLEPNPRSMKRLVNSLALEKATNYLSGLSDLIDDDHLVRWAILKSRFPLIANDMKRDREKFHEYIDTNLYPEIAPILAGLNPDLFFKLMPN